MKQKAIFYFLKACHYFSFRIIPRVAVRNEHNGTCCAWIVLHAGEQASAEEVQEFCRGQIAHYKVPKYIRFVDELPMTVTGKIQKFLMRQQTIEELGLTVQETA